MIVARTKTVRVAKKGVSINKSLHVHSSEYCDYVDNDPHAYCFHTRLIKEDMVESAASDMPNEASGGSEHSQQASCSNTKRIHEKVIAEPNEEQQKTILSPKCCLNLPLQ